MSKKKKTNVKISFIGQNANEVTGSMTLIEFRDKKILLECGLYQDGSIFDTYKVNSRRFPFKAKEIDYVFLNHAHIDHTGLLGKLVKEGFRGRVISSKITKKFCDPLLGDSAFIVSRDAEFLSKRKGKVIPPLYEESDAKTALELIEDHKYKEIIELDDTVSFKFLHNSHIPGAAQLELYLKDENSRVRKLLYTSDMGSMRLKKCFVSDMDYCTKANIVITESTYGQEDRLLHKKDRDKDIEKIKSIILETCLERNGRILIPCFSLDRTQYMLKILYDIFGNDPNFKIPIVIDSPLSCKITKIYQDVLEGEDKEIIDEITSWKNLRMISENCDSKANIADKSPKVVLSSSGFLTAGRSVKYLKEFLPHTNDMVLFVGYASPSSLAYKIKNGKSNKTISIEGKPYRNRCGVVCLNSFSSHIQRDEIINYMKSIACDKIVLVHGEEKSKLSLKYELEEELGKMGKTTKVVCAHKGMEVNF
jgi:metallo-beta-lactamase family protein